MLTTDNSRLSLMGLYAIPTSSLSAADIQQFILYRDPVVLVVGGISRSTLIAGGGTLLTAIDINKLLSISTVGGGVLSSVININKALTSLIQGGGVLNLNLTKYTSTSTYINGGGIQATQIAKQMQQQSVLTTSSNLIVNYNIIKQAFSSISGNTSGIIVNLIKNTAIINDVSGTGNLVDSIQVNKSLNTIFINGGGNITAVYLKNFSDTNIIYINLDNLTYNTTLNNDVITLATTQEFISYANI